MFNPHFHEVVAHVPEAGPEDQIVDELEPGYTLHDRLLRAAKVRVRVSPQPKTPASEEKQEEIT
jgi:molecular chaperone GrpE